MPLEPSRVVANLERLRAETGDESGAQRVAWTETWVRGRALLAEALGGLPLEVERDEAGNDWYTLRGASDREVLLGSHIDSVPNGGWLDGCLGCFAGAEVLRRIAGEGTPPVTVRLVDWADEEGARLRPVPPRLVGRLRVDARPGRASPSDRSRRNAPARGARHPRRRARPHDRGAQPARECRGIPRAAYRAGARARVPRPPTRRGARDIRASSAIGSPGRVRRPTPARPRWRSAAMRSPVLRSSPWRSAISPRRSAVAPFAPRGASSAGPASSLSVVETVEQLLDQRHLAAGQLAELLHLAQEASRRFAEEERLDIAWERIWGIEPILFDETLIGLCETAVREVAGTSHRLPSGPAT